MMWLRRTFYFLAAVCILLVVYYRVWFLRQPDRNVPHNEHLFVSPANGLIVAVKPWSSTSLVETKGNDGAIKVWTKDVDTAGYIVSIQMDVTNVHYQRAPATATLLAEVHTAGDYHNAVVMSNDYGIRFENEHNEMLFATGSGKKFKIIQIAGFVARRIEDYVETKQEVKQGDIIGLIKLGSQVTVILPSGVDLKAKVGDKVVDGESVLAEW